MIPRIQKILYATDLSQNSAYAFRYAINSAIQHDASIIILHVFETVSPNNSARLELYLGKQEREKILKEGVTRTIDRIKKRLKIFCEKELEENPKCAQRVASIEVCVGFTAEVILRKADELDCDAIVMGTHGKGVISHTFFGSTARRVLRRTRKPVFVIPLPHGEIDITFHD